jgi:hypothetical protein
MARIKIVDPGKARGIRKLLFKIIKRQYGGVTPGIFKILLTDLKLGKATGDIYKHLHLRKSSPISRLQREMLATVVNGLVGGVP